MSDNQFSAFAVKQYDAPQFAQDQFSAFSRAEKQSVERVDFAPFKAKHAQAMRAIRAIRATIKACPAILRDEFKRHLA